MPIYIKLSIDIQTICNKKPKKCNLIINNTTSKILVKFLKNRGLEFVNPNTEYNILSGGKWFEQYNEKRYKYDIIEFCKLLSEFEYKTNTIKPYIIELNSLNRGRILDNVEIINEKTISIKINGFEISPIHIKTFEPKNGKFIIKHYYKIRYNEIENKIEFVNINSRYCIGYDEIILDIDLEDVYDGCNVTDFMNYVKRTCIFYELM